VLIFAIAPVLLVAIAIAGLAFGAEAVRGEIVGQIDQLVGREGARTSPASSTARHNEPRSPVISGGKR
jgi:hypothetical protein